MCSKRWCKQSNLRVCVLRNEANKVIKGCVLGYEESKAISKYVLRNEANKTKQSLNVF